MRVISGICKGHPLKSPKGSGTRPVLDQVKEAIFNILPSPEGLYILDLFAGTGALGIEGLSRGATEAVFVEKDPHCASILIDNLNRCHLDTQAHVLIKPAIAACRLLRKKKRHFDWIFCDPPYDQNLLNPTLNLDDFLALTTTDTRLIIEHSPRERPDSKYWQIFDERLYGQTLISFLKRS